MSENRLDLHSMRGKASLARVLPGPEKRPAAPDPAAEDEESCPAFGFLRGIRDKALTLELRFANGNSRGFPYSWLGPVQYDPSAGLLLKFVGDLVYLVLIEGSRLNTLVNGAISLYDRGILRHRITFIREMDPDELEKAGEGEAMVSRIRIHSHRADEEPKGVEWLEAFKER